MLWTTALRVLVFYPVDHEFFILREGTQVSLVDRDTLVLLLKQQRSEDNDEQR